MMEYMSRKDVDRKKMAKDLKGLKIFNVKIEICFLGFEKNINVRDKITKLSANYWSYKGFYNFPQNYKG